MSEEVKLSCFYGTYHLDVCGEVVRWEPNDLLSINGARQARSNYEICKDEEHRKVLFDYLGEG